MTMPQLLETLSGKGYTVSLHGEKLNIKPIPDPATVEALRQHKSEIISFLSDKRQPTQEEINAVLCPLYSMVDSGKVSGPELSCLLDELQSAEDAKDWRLFRELLNRAKELKK